MDALRGVVVAMLWVAIIVWTGFVVVAATAFYGDIAALYAEYGGQLGRKMDFGILIAAAVAWAGPATAMAVMVLVLKVSGQS